MVKSALNAKKRGQTVLWTGAKFCVCMFMDSKDKYSIIKENERTKEDIHTRLQITNAQFDFVMKFNEHKKNFLLTTRKLLEKKVQMVFLKFSNGSWYHDIKEKVAQNFFKNSKKTNKQ